MFLAWTISCWSSVVIHLYSESILKKNILEVPSGECFHQQCTVHFSKSLPSFFFSFYLLIISHYLFTFDSGSTSVNMLVFPLLNSRMNSIIYRLVVLSNPNKKQLINTLNHCSFTDIIKVTSMEVNNMTSL